MTPVVMVLLVWIYLIVRYVFILIVSYVFMIHSIIEEKMTFNSYYCQVGEGKLALGEKLKEK